MDLKKQKIHPIWATRSKLIYNTNQYISKRVKFMYNTKSDQHFDEEICDWISKILETQLTALILFLKVKCMRVVRIGVGPEPSMFHCHKFKGITIYYIFH